MAEPLIPYEEMQLILDDEFSEARYNAVYSAGLRAVRTAYKGDPEAAQGLARDTVVGVLQGVIARIMSNPKGVRTLGLGSGNLTFGGADEQMTATFALTDDERADLAAVSPRRSTGAFTIRPGGAAR